MLNRYNRDYSGPLKLWILDSILSARCKHCEALKNFKLQNDTWILYENLNLLSYWGSAERNAEVNSSAKRLLQFKKKKSQEEQEGKKVDLRRKAHF